MAQSTKVAPERGHTIPIRDEFAEIIIEMAERTGHKPEDVLDALLRYHLIVAPKIITASLDASARPEKILSIRCKNCGQMIPVSAGDNPHVCYKKGGIDVRF